MDYNGALAFLGSLSQESRTTQESLKLERITLLLQLLGNPHQSFQSIHIAGTSGKGSTATLCASILQAHGFKTGLHASPHIQIVNERMQVDGLMASREEFGELAGEVEPLCSQVERETGMGKPTYYEATLATAFLHFKKSRCKFAVVETGLGGRLDGTNVLLPSAVILTNVGLDHTQILGTTIKEIAWEKGGIVKEGVPVFTAASGEALDVFREACAKKNAQISVLGKDILLDSVDCAASGSSFGIRLPSGASFQSLALSMAGRHQVDNAALAIAAASSVTMLDEGALKLGLLATTVPVRLEVMQESPRVILDGAHNPPKSMALAAALPSMVKGRLVMVVGISANKDAATILKEFGKLNARFIFTKGKGPHEFHSPQSLAQIAGKPDSLCEESVASAVQKAIGVAGPSGTVCVTGSLYVAGEARGRWLPNEIALDQRDLKIRRAP